MSSLIRFQPGVTTLSDLFDDAVTGNFFSRWNRELEETTFPNVDIVEGKDGFQIKADMPGLDKKDIRWKWRTACLALAERKRKKK